MCNFKDYCAEGHECDSVHSTCVTLETKEKCVAADKEGLECEEGDRWYYYCNCTAGYMGINCALEDEGIVSNLCCALNSLRLLKLELVIYINNRFIFVRLNCL